MQNAAEPVSERGAADIDPASVPGKPTLKSRGLSELRHFAVITLYLWVLFVLLSHYKTMILHEEGINVWEQSFAIINALVCAKVILIAQALKFGERLQKFPMIYSVLGKSLSFTIVLFAVHILEEAIKAIVKGLPLVTSMTDFAGGDIQGFLTLGGIFFVALIPFFAFEEAERMLGKAAVWKLFLSPRTKTFRLIQE